MTAEEFLIKKGILKEGKTKYVLYSDHENEIKIDGDLLREFHEYKMGQHLNENNVETLRDKFAIGSISGILIESDHELTIKEMVDVSYCVADEMIERRKLK